MRIIVFSDTHGNFSNAETIVKRNLGADIFIFLGDGERDLDLLTHLYPEKHFAAVAGNCDMFSSLPEVSTVSFDGVKIIFTHGHNYNVRSSDSGMYNLALREGADIALFGHTHERHYRYADGIHILNPGSAGCPRDGKPPSFAIIDVSDKGILVNHVDV